MWKNIWQSKGKNLKNINLDISDLINLDGFDTSGKSFNKNSWIEYVEYVSNTANINNGKKSVLEIGCGSGAFLKVLSDIINDKLNISGIDYSDSLINIAKNIIKDGNFYCDEAIKIDDLFVNKKFDFIFSNSAFQYFPNKEYAFDVIKKSYDLLSDNGDLVLLDLNDINRKSVYINIRKASMSEEEYNKKYAGLEHLFLSRSEIFDFIYSLGFRKIIIEDQNVSGYINNECRFNAFALSKK